jgi:hypothetical protein
MSIQPQQGPGGGVQRAGRFEPPAPKSVSVDVYTVMLILAFCFVTVAVILMGMELLRYGPGVPWKPSVAGAS